MNVFFVFLIGTYLIGGPPSEYTNHQHLKCERSELGSDLATSTSIHLYTYTLVLLSIYSSINLFTIIIMNV